MNIQMTHLIVLHNCPSDKQSVLVQQLLNQLDQFGHNIVEEI